MRNFVFAAAGALLIGSAFLGAQSKPTLDYEAFKTRIEPIFLAKHDGFARCYVCHSQGTNFRLQRLNDGATTWTEEQSKMNFEAVKKFVAPGNMKSRLLLMPLVHEAGGTEFHPGGKRWTSQEHPEWKIVAAWVNGK
jgi:hypothetical protein